MSDKRSHERVGEGTNWQLKVRLWVSKFASKQAIEQAFPFLLSPLSKTNFML